jgi:CheY-like chemotaxis protein
MHRTIMIVEDDAAIREAVKDSFDLLGYSVLSASNGREALQALSSADQPCLILLDIMMPVMDGWEFRRQQLADPKLAQIPVVVMTADGNAQEKAMRMQAELGLRKPLELDDLTSVAKRYCG